MQSTRSPSIGLRIAHKKIFAPILLLPPASLSASLLTAKLGEERVISYQFTRPGKSKLTYHFLSLVNSGRLKVYRQDEAPGPHL